MADNSKIASSAMQSGMQAGMATGNPWAALAGAGIGAAGAYMGSQEEEAGARAQQEQLQRLYDQVMGIATPTVEEQKLQLALQQVVGKYDPAQQIAQQLEGNYYSGVQADPQMEAQQRSYLEQLKQLAAQGMTPVEQAQRNALMRSVEAQTQGKMQDIEREQAQKGMASSGASLLSKLVAQQQAQSGAATDADRLASEMFQRQMGAGQSASDLANQMDIKQYQRAMGLGEKRQAIDEFNTNVRNQAQAANVGAQNQAQQYNLGSAQRVADANVGTSNDQQRYNKALLQQDFENKLKKTMSASGIGTNIGNSMANIGQLQGARTSAIGQLIGGGIDKGSQYFKTKKQDEEN